MNVGLSRRSFSELFAARTDIADAAEYSNGNDDGKSGPEISAGSVITDIRLLSVLHAALHASAIDADSFDDGGSAACPRTVAEASRSSIELSLYERGRRRRTDIPWVVAIQ